MSDWSEIKRPFRDALIAAFNWSRLAVVLIYHCDRRLDRITAENEGFDKNVDDVIADAVQTGWLEKLAKGALAENETHTGLNATVPHILKGVATEGKAYYQGTIEDPSNSVVSDRTVDPNQDRIPSSDDQVGNGHDKADSRWTYMLQAALDQWRSNLSAIKSLSRTAGQAAAVGAAVTVIGTLLYLALTVNQEESDRLLLVFGSLLFAGAAFVFGQIWGRVLIFAYFILEQLPDPIQAVTLAAVGGITGYFVFYMMVQTFVYSWVPGAIAGLAMAGLAHMNLRSMWKANWTVPILAAALTMIICYAALVYSNEAELGNAFGVLARGIFVAIFVRKSLDMPFLVPGKSDKVRS